MNYRSIAFAFFSLFTCTVAQTSAQVIIQNRTDKPLQISFDGRVDHHYAHTSKELTSFIPHMSIIKNFNAVPPHKNASFTIPPLQNASLSSHYKQQFLAHQLIPTQTTIRGILVINNKAYHSVEEPLNSSGNFIITIMPEDL